MSRNSKPYVRVFPERSWKLTDAQRKVLEKSLRVFQRCARGEGSAAELAEMPYLCYVLKSLVESREVLHCEERQACYELLEMINEALARTFEGSDLRIGVGTLWRYLVNVAGVAIRHANSVEIALRIAWLQVMLGCEVTSNVAGVELGRLVAAFPPQPGTLR